MNLSRRRLFQLAGAGAIAAALPRFSAAAPDAAPSKEKTTNKPNNASYRFRIGDWEAVNFGGGVWDLPNAHGIFAPQASKEQFSEALAEECLPNDKLRLYFNILLIKTGKDNILIDAGFEGEQSTPFNLAANLAEHGLKVSDISKVFLTHAHSDHFGGMLNANRKPTFSNAEHFCLEEEHAFWTSPKLDLSSSRMDPKSLQGFIAGAQKLFAQVPFTKLKRDSKLPEGIEALHSPGHTPGHMTLRLSSAGETVYHIADLAHHHAIMIPHPEWTVAFDSNETQAAATRKEIFSRLAAEKTNIFAYHMPFPGLGKLKPQGAGYRWTARSWDPAL